MKYFNDLQIDIDEGNDIFPSGNAVKYLKEYFIKQPPDMNFMCGQAPYTSALNEVNGIAVNPDGNVVVCSFPISNIYEKDILDILNEYNPMNNPFTAALMESGISGLIAYAESIGIKINPEEYYSPCGICRSLAQSELYR